MDQLSFFPESLPSSEVPIVGDDVHFALLAGRDPLGDRFLAARSLENRRATGATYTPPGLVAAMLDRATQVVPDPERVVDVGAGSGRFAVAAALRWPQARVIAVETDREAAAVLRANVEAAGVAKRVKVALKDFRDLELEPIAGRTLFVGNPPYIRHHGLTRKEWLRQAASGLGLKASLLSGLHVHLLIKAALSARPGDAAVLVVAAEWMDTGYGDVLRQGLAGPMGGLSVHVAPADAGVFDAMATAAVITFAPGWVGPITFGIIGEGWSFSDVQTVERRTAREEPQWSRLVQASAPREVADTIPLGQLFRCSRGQVTGDNSTFIAGPNTPPLPSACLVPTITRARELIEAGPELRSTDGLRRVVDLPADLGTLLPDERHQVAKFVAWAEGRGARGGYIARHRSPWWRVSLRPPPPIWLTYMGRRPPAFVRNLAGALALNIAHGLYPRKPMDDATLDRITGWLREHVSVADGRTYAGGLTKFEPSEVERIRIPAQLGVG